MQYIAYRESPRGRRYAARRVCRSGAPGALRGSTAAGRAQSALMLKSNTRPIEHLHVISTFHRIKPDGETE